MKKTLLALGTLVLALLMILVVSDVVAGHMARERLQARRVHWAAVARQIPIGATHEQVARWARRTLPHPDEDGSSSLISDPQTLSFMAETIPEPGLKFPARPGA